MSALNVDRATWLAVGSEMQTSGLGLMVENLLRGMKPADFEAAAAALKESYTFQAELAGQPFRAKVTATDERQKRMQQEMQSLMADAMKDVPPNTPRENAQVAVFELFDKKLSEGAKRGTFLVAWLKSGSKFENNVDASGPFVHREVQVRSRLAGAQALIALRRWYGTHAESPTDIAMMCREAGLAEVPRDPYGEGPLRMATFAAETPIEHRFQKNLKVLAGETVLYSIGPDGIDDKALKDFGPSLGDPGDWLFRLEIPQSSIPVTPAPAATPIP
jgi:hypothetical protein